MFFKLSNDLYFSNIELLSDEKQLLAILKNSMNTIIDLNLGKGISYKSFLRLDLSIKDDFIMANCIEVSPNFSPDLEYAFYLLIDGKKEDVFWYTDEKKIKITKPKNIASKRLSVSCFVREKNNPNKKIAYTKAL